MFYVSCFMILIIGLGNPGKKYQNTRHNIGFRIIDEFGKKNIFPEFRLSKKIKAEISESSLDNKKILLAKPQTFMNESGKAVKLLNSKFNLPASATPKALRAGILNSKLLVVHDDIDLPLGKIKIVENRGSAGHKGVQSIIDELGTKNFFRFRVGIKPEQTYRPVRRSENFVLKNFTKEEEKILKEVIKKTCQGIEIAIKQGIEKAQST